jgi:hypothetical protein
VFVHFHVTCVFQPSTFLNSFYGGRCREQRAHLGSRALRLGMAAAASEWSRGDASDMDGQNREVECAGAHESCFNISELSLTAVLVKRLNSMRCFSAKRLPSRPTLGAQAAMSLTIFSGRLSLCERMRPNEKGISNAVLGAITRSLADLSRWKPNSFTWGRKCLTALLQSRKKAP